MRTRANTSSMIRPDLISSLPDTILHHILGFLQTNEAVKTCVLSKRWEHLWASVHSLRFNLDDFMQWDNERIAKFVNAVMLRRDPLDLDVFHLYCGDTIMDGHVSDWINYAVKHRPRVLYFWYFSSLPSCIYTCTSIEELYLSECKVIISRTVNLPKLKKLVMNYIYDAPSLKNLLSRCPILEYLEITYYICSECVIAHEHLKHLRISDCSFQTLLIDAPKLLSFSFILWDCEEDPSPPHKADMNMPSLMIGSLKSGWFEMSDYLDVATSLLQSLSNAELLKLHFSRDQLKELCGLLLPLPVFHKLKHVTVSFYEFACFELVAWILKSSPNLRKLTLLQDFDDFDFAEMEATTSGSTDASLTAAITSCKKLEMIEVRYYKRTEMVGRLLDAFVDGAKELENMKIQFIQI